MNDLPDPPRHREHARHLKRQLSGIPNTTPVGKTNKAHIAASASYQRLFAHFQGARTLLMSACFQRLDSKPIDADVVYRYRLVDSVADGSAKNLRVHRFAPEVASTVYEAVWLDGRREQIEGRAALLATLGDERKMARITAQSEAPIRQVMAVTRARLDAQAKLLAPVKPRALFAAMGQAHAEQITRIAEEYGIPSATLHHSMPASAIASTRRRFESDAGDLQGIVQLRMLGQGYDFPPITVVVPLRPYGSFGEFYQFVGRGVRVLRQTAAAADQQYLDVVCHAELGLEEQGNAVVVGAGRSGSDESEPDRAGADPPVVPTASARRCP
ncbi:DEAD/DEAH box helicase [Streptomyces sp. NPDC001809]